MIKPEKGKDDVPDNEETEKEYKINNFDPHGKELFKGNQIEPVVDNRGGQAKGKDHNQQIKKFESFE
jgi:hypothetical protein